MGHEPFVQPDESDGETEADQRLVGEESGHAACEDDLAIEDETGADLLDQPGEREGDQPEQPCGANRPGRKGPPSPHSVLKRPPNRPSGRASVSAETAAQPAG